jgi:hypothetical protein
MTQNRRDGGSDKVQGEGDYDAARRYRKDVQDYVQSGQSDEAARGAKPDDPAQAAEIEAAERTGKSHSKGEAAGDDAQMRDRDEQAGHEEPRPGTGRPRE